MTVSNISSINKEVAMRKSLFFLFCFVIFCSCGRKADIPQITAWERYDDPYFEISFRHPQGWPVIPEGGRFAVYSSQDVITKFYEFSPEGKDGIRLIVSDQKIDTLLTIDQYVSELKRDFLNSGFEIRSSEPKSIGDLPGIMLSYRGTIDRNNIVEGVQVAAIRDNDIFTVKYEAFNELFTACYAVFDTALASLRLPEPKVAVASAEEDLAVPSTEFKEFSNKYLKLSYPANFQISQAQAKAPVEFSMGIKGYRQDSNVHIDIRPSQGLTAEKVVEQNAKNFRETSRGTTTIDGVNTTYINYSPMKDVQSRVYFLVKGDRFYRVILNYYAPMKSVYLPVFEKVVASMATR